MTLSLQDMEIYVDFFKGLILNHVVLVSVARRWDQRGLSREDCRGRAITQRCTGAAPSSTTLSFRTSVGRAKRPLPSPASMARHPSTAVPGLSITGFLLCNLV